MAYREVVFELSGQRIITPLFAALTAEAAARSRLQAMSISDTAATVLIDHAGSTNSVTRLRRLLEAPPSAALVGAEILEDGPRHMRAMVTWARPQSPSAGVSLEHALHDVAGTGALLFGRIEEGRIVYKAAGPDGEGLRQFLGRIQDDFGDRLRVHHLRSGPYTPGWESAAERRVVAASDEVLLSAALSAGYYDEPKRCGVRELGQSLGVSKSVVARRLRQLERRALETYVDLA